jgi:hypothetical protein
MVLNQFLYILIVEGSKNYISSYLVMDLLRKSQLLLVHLNMKKVYIIQLFYLVSLKGKA